MSGDKNCFPLLTQDQGHLQKGNLWSSFRQTERGGRRTLPTLVDSQLPSTQNNIYVKVAHFGVAYPRPLQYQNISNQKEGNMQKLHQDWNAN